MLLILVDQFLVVDLVKLIEVDLLINDERVGAEVVTDGGELLHDILHRLRAAVLPSGLEVQQGGIGDFDIRHEAPEMGDDPSCQEHKKYEWTVEREVQS